jgi:hypothetical protein
MSDTGMSQESGRVDRKLIPVMREAVVMVQMVLFKVLREDMRNRYVDRIEPIIPAWPVL